VFIDGKSKRTNLLKARRSLKNRQTENSSNTNADKLTLPKPQNTNK